MAVGVAVAVGFIGFVATIRTRQEIYWSPICMIFVVVGRNTLLEGNTLSGGNTLLGGKYFWGRNTLLGDNSLLGGNTLFGPTLYWDTTLY